MLVYTHTHHIASVLIPKCIQYIAIAVQTNVMYNIQCTVRIGNSRPCSLETTPTIIPCYHIRSEVSGLFNDSSGESFPLFYCKTLYYTTCIIITIIHLHVRHLHICN